MEKEFKRSEEKYMIADFQSDTTAGVSEPIMQAIVKANVGCELGYFQDHHTENVRKWVSEQFSVPVKTFFISNGTAVNILAMRTMTNRISSIVCTSNTHIAKSEMGAMEYAMRTKIITVEGKDGKISIDKIKKSNFLIGHNPPIRIVVFSQPTEYGTCYTTREIKQICDFAHANGMYVYFDGARIANALSFLKCSLKELVEDTGIDAFAIGGNKNGCMFGELLVIVNPQLFDDVDKYQKQLALTFSKTRFFTAQFEAYFKNKLWLKNAEHSNAMSKYLEERLREIGFEPVFPVQTNTVFVKMDYDLVKKLSKTYILGYHDKAKKIVRLMTNFNTTKQDVDKLIETIKKCK